MHIIVNMSETIHLNTIIPAEFEGMRLDQALAKLFPDYSRSRIQEWIKAGQVQVNGMILRAKDKVKADQSITIDATIEPRERWEPQPIELSIVYEDDAIIVVNKPPGLVVHPATGNPDKTLVNALLHHAPELATLPRAGIVHRLDKNTSGLLVIARNLTAHTHLAQQIQSRTAKREYVAIVHGEFISGGTVNAPLGRHPSHRTHIAVIEYGKPAITHYRIRQKFRGFTALNIMLETGRTHQIRVHMAYIHHPVVGDQTYGGRQKIPANCSESLKQTIKTFKRQALHAAKLTIIHPVTNKPMIFTAKMPEDMQSLWDLLAEIAL